MIAVWLLVAMLAGVLGLLMEVAYGRKTWPFSVAPAFGTYNSRWLRHRSMTDRHGLSDIIGTIFVVVIMIVIALALFGTVLTSIAAQNSTTKYGPASNVPAWVGILNLIPLLFILIIVAAIIGVVIALFKGL